MAPIGDGHPVYQRTNQSFHRTNDDGKVSQTPSFPPYTCGAKREHYVGRERLKASAPI